MPEHYPGKPDIPKATDGRAFIYWREYDSSFEDILAKKNGVTYSVTPFPVVTPTGFKPVTF